EVLDPTGLVFLTLAKGLPHVVFGRRGEGGAEPARVLPLLPASLRQRADAVIGGEHQEVIALAYFGVEESEQIAQEQIGPQGGVEHFLRIRPPRVSDGIVRGKANQQ